MAAERLTRSRLAQAASPTAVDPTVELLRLFSEARQDAIAVLQGNNARPKLCEACGRLRQASSQLLDMVREDLEYLEDPMGEGGGLAKPTTARLPQAQAGRAVAFLVDACHLTMRALLQQCEQEDPRALALASQPPPPGKDVIGVDGGASTAAAASSGGGGQPDAAALAAAQLWRAAVSVATALQDASRLLAVPRFYSAFTIADPSCDALLSVGELAAAVMRRASATSAAATAAAREALRKQRQGQGPGQQGAGLKSEAEALAPSDASCMLAAHGSSLLLVACEQQPESLLDALLRQPGGSERLHVIASAVLELAAARITETAFCGGGGNAASAQPHSSSHPDSSSLSSPLLPLPSSAEFSFQYRQLQLVAMRFSELLADDGSYKAMSKRALLPALAEALLAEPHRFVSWWGCGRDALYAGLSARDLLAASQLADRATAAAIGGGSSGGAAGAAPSAAAAPPLLPPPLPPPACNSSHDDKLQTSAVGLLLKSPAARNLILPLLLGCVRLPGAGAGLAAFGECFAEERFICTGEGLEREELYVGGRGRGYKRRKILNPDAHGVNSDQVGLVLAAMASALEAAVLLCKVLSNASVDPPPSEAAPTAPPSQSPPGPGRGGGIDAGADDPVIGPPSSAVAAPAGGGAAGRGGAAAMEVDAAGGEGHEQQVQGQGQSQSQSPPLASAFLQLLESRYGCGGGADGGLKRRESGDGADAVAAAAAAVVVSSQMALMGRNLATLLSLLLPVCPGGGEEVRDSIRELGYPSLRWPRMNVRLPVLVVDQDCELLVGLLEDVTAAASEAARRREEERRQRDSEAKRSADRDDRRRKRQEAEQKEAERRQRDKERRQRDRDRLKELKAAGLATGGEYDDGGGGDELNFEAGGVGEAATAGAAGHQPKVRLVLRRGGGGAGGVPLDGGGSPDQLDVARQRKRSRADEDEDYDAAHDAEVYEHAAAREDPLFAARLAAVRGGQWTTGNGLSPELLAAAAAGADGIGGGEEEEEEEEEEAMPGGLQVPRQRRSNRPPEVLDQRFGGSAAAAAAAGRRTSASGGGGGGYPAQQHQQQHLQQQYHQQQLLQQQHLQSGYGGGPSPLKRPSLGLSGGGSGVDVAGGGAGAGGAAMRQQCQAQAHAHQRQPGPGQGPMGHSSAWAPGTMPPSSYYELQQQQPQHMPRQQPPPSPGYGAMGQHPQGSQPQQAAPRSQQPQQQYSQQPYSHQQYPPQHYAQQQQQPHAHVQYMQSHPAAQRQQGPPGGAVGAASPHARGPYSEGSAMAAEGFDGSGASAGAAAVALGGMGQGRIPRSGGEMAPGGGYPPQRHPQQPQHQQQQYQYQQAPHLHAHTQGGGGGGGGYAHGADTPHAPRQHAVDPSGLAQQQRQQLQYQQQYQQQYEQQYQQQYEQQYQQQYEQQYQ